MFVLKYVLLVDCNCLSKIVVVMVGYRFLIFNYLIWWDEILEVFVINDVFNILNRWLMLFFVLLFGWIVRNGFVSWFGVLRFLRFCKLLLRFLVYFFWISDLLLFSVLIIFCSLFMYFLILYVDICGCVLLIMVLLLICLEVWCLLLGKLVRGDYLVVDFVVVVGWDESWGMKFL